MQNVTFMLNLNSFASKKITKLPALIKVLFVLFFINNDFIYINNNLILKH